MSRQSEPADPAASEQAKAYIDTILADRDRLGYSRKVAKKSYGQAVDRTAGVFETLRRTSRSEENSEA